MEGRRNEEGLAGGAVLLYSYAANMLLWGAVTCMLLPYRSRSLSQRPTSAILPSMPSKFNRGNGTMSHQSVIGTVSLRPAVFRLSLTKMGESSYPVHLYFVVLYLYAQRIRTTVPQCADGTHAMPRGKNGLSWLDSGWTRRCTT